MSTKELSALFQNGIDAISNGIEDFKLETPARRLSSAIRNVTAGVLLILKERLRRFGTNADEELQLLAQNVVVVPKQVGGKLANTVITRGNETVNVATMRDRLMSLGVNLGEWHRVDSLVKLRNNVEHHVMVEPVSQARAAIGNATAFLEVFLRTEMGVLAAEVFPYPVWEAMLEIKAVVEQLQETCLKSRRGVTMPTAKSTEFLAAATCFRCGEPQLLEFVGTGDLSDVDVNCHGCGLQVAGLTFLSLGLNNHFDVDAYEAMKEGGVPPLSWCETCLKDTFVRDAEHCFGCGTGREFGSCGYCSAELAESEYLANETCGLCAKRFEAADAALQGTAVTTP